MLTVATGIVHAPRYRVRRPDDKPLQGVGHACRMAALRSALLK